MNGPSQPPGPEAEISADDSGLSRLSGIFLQPEATFQAINRRPNWLLPMLAVMVVSLLANTFVISTIGYETLMRENIDQRLGDMPREEREEIIASQVESQMMKVFTYLAPGFGFIAVLLVAGVLLLGVTLAGGQSTFRQVLSVTGHSFFAYSLVSSVLVCLVVYLNPEEVVANLQTAVQSHLGFLVDSKESPVLFTLASSIDLLSFYFMYLLAKGLAAAPKRLSFASALAVVVVLWIVWVGLKTGFAALTS